MNSAREGFTIIEVVIFLGITAMLVVGLLSVTGATIERQRFSDSVNTLQALVQQQYNESVNVVNARTSGSCKTDPGNTITSPTPNTVAGTTDCLILGKAIDFPTGSSAVTTYNVVGHEPIGGADTTKPAADLLKQYTPSIDTTSKATFNIAWNAQIVGSSPGGDNRMLLLRSPDSGLLGSYFYDSSNSIDTAFSSSVSDFYVCLRSADITNATAYLHVLSTVSGSEAVQSKFDPSSAELGAVCT